MNELQRVFEYEGSKIRTLVKEGQLWLVAKDVADILGYANTRKAIRDHCKNAQEIGGNESFLLDPQTLIIPEHDMYRLIMRSKLPSAERFEEWVTGEVLPSIRKTGKYEIASTLPDFSSPAIAARAWAEQWEKRQLAEVKVKELEPKAAFADAVNDSSNSMDLGTFAKILGTGRTRFFEWLREQGYLMAGGTKPYQKYIDNGYFVVIETTFTKGDTTQTYGKTQICGKGQLAIERLWREQHKEAA